MCVKKVESWRAKDGSIHKTERNAILSTIETIINGNNLGFGGEHKVSNINVLQIEKSLPELMPLFAKLSDPRNTARRAEALDTRTFESVAIIDTPSEDRMEIDATELIVDPGALTMPLETLSLDDFRLGQMVEAEDGEGGLITGIVTEIFPEDPDGHHLALAQIVDGVPLSHWNVMATVSDITRIAKQPEELLGLDEARKLFSIMSNTTPPVEQASQHHKSKVLLLRRIAELEGAEDNG